MNTPALFLGDDTLTGLGVARNLGRNGVPVLRVGSRDNPQLASRFISDHWVIPDLEACSDSEFVAKMSALASRSPDRPVLFPGSDLHVLRLTRTQEHLETFFRFTTCNRNAAEILANKMRFSSFLEDAGIPHPRTQVIQNHADLESAGPPRFPVFLKPEYSQRFSECFGCKGFVANTQAELTEHLKRVWDAGLQVILQEIIPGPANHMCGCAGYHDGRTITSFCYRRIREYPHGFGCGTFIETVPSFFARTKLGECLERLAYCGIFDAEFKLDPRDNAFKLIEINARSWWQNALPTGAGFNVIHAAYLDAMGQPAPKRGHDSYRSGVKWVSLNLDLKSMLEDGGNPLSWLWSLKGTRTFAVLAVDDPRPFVRLTGGILQRKILRR